MSFNWKPIANTLRNSVVGFLGGDVTIERVSGATVSPIPGRDVPRDTPISALRAVFRAVLKKLDTQYRDGGIVGEANAMFVVSPGDFEPKAGDKLTVGGSVYEILQVHHIRPNGADTVVHKCMVSL